MIYLLAQTFTEASSEEIKSGWGSLVFMGCFFLALIIAGIWWLRRSA
jgi:uncharacterized membrane protein AbrB (regulator of aidB expression)